MFEGELATQQATRIVRHAPQPLLHGLLFLGLARVDGLGDLLGVLVALFLQRLLHLLRELFLRLLLLRLVLRRVVGGLALLVALLALRGWPSFDCASSDASDLDSLSSCESDGC